MRIAAFNKLHYVCNCIVGEPPNAFFCRRGQVIRFFFFLVCKQAWPVRRQTCGYLLVASELHMHPFAIVRNYTAR